MSNNTDLPKLPPLGRWQWFTRELVTELRLAAYELGARSTAAQPLAPSDTDDCNACCPRCDGSGEETEMDSAGPDAREVTIHCKHCEGRGTLIAAYHGLVRSLEIEHKARMRALAQLYVRPATPPEPEAVARDRADAARYRWLRDISEPGICAFYLSVGKAFDGVKFARGTVDEAIDAQIAAQPEPRHGT